MSGALVEAERPTPWRSAWLAAALTSVPVFGYGGPLGLVIPAIAGGVAFAPFALGERRIGREWWVLAALLVWAVISTSWSPATPTGPLRGYADIEALTAVKLALQLLTFGALVRCVRGVSAEGAERALAWAGSLTMAWAALLLVDGISDGLFWSRVAWVFGVETPRHLWAKKAAEGAYVFAVVIWPIAGVLARHRGIGVAAAVLVAAALGMAGLSAWSAFVAMFTGGAALLLVRRFGFNGGRALGVLLALAVATTPMVVLFAEGSGLSAAVQDRLTASWAARLDIWRFVADAIGQNAFRGWGLDASRTLGPAVPLHPHSGALQLWLELGAPGALLGGLFWMLVGRRVARLADVHAGAAQVAAASLAAYFTVGALSFGVWQEWWIAAGALAAAACAAYARLPVAEVGSLSEIGSLSEAGPGSGSALRE